MKRMFGGRLLLPCLMVQFYFLNSHAQPVVLSSVQGSIAGRAQGAGLTMTATAGQSSPVGAVSGGGVTGGSGFEFTLGGSDVTAPSIQHTPVLTQNNGQGLQITATISDIGGVAGSTLYFRKGGDVAFTSLPMSLSGGVYQATIPAGSVTPNGVEYYITASDLVGNLARNPASGVLPVQVIVSGEGVASSSAQPGGNAQTAYRLVSVPMEITSNTVQSVLFDDLGAYDNTQWRFYSLAADQSYVEYPTVATMDRGKGYWLIVKDPGKIIDTGPARSLVTNTQFTMQLNQGWNFIGDPFAFTLPVSKLSLSSGQPVQLRSYTGAWNDTTQAVTSLQPITGYAIFANSATILSMNPDLTTISLGKQGVVSASGISWAIGIKAQCDQARDVDNLAAVSADAGQELDNLDWVEPPVIGEFVSVYFPHHLPDNQTAKLCVDVKPIPTEGEGWDFDVRTNIAQPVTLSFDNSTSVPSDFGIVLLDEVLKSTQDLRQTRTYIIPAREAADPLPFKLIVGKPEFIQQQIALNGLVPASYELSQNFPNPFNPTTTIRYGLPKESHVTLKVYNILGQEVATLVDAVQEQGYKVVQFPPSGSEGMSSGTYFYRLQAGDFTQTRKLTLLK